MKSIEAQQYILAGGRSRKQSAWEGRPFIGRGRRRSGLPSTRPYPRSEAVSEDFDPVRKADIQTSRGGGRADWTLTEASGLGREDFFRYIDTRLRRVESGGSAGSRVTLTGPRRMLKDVIDSIGHVSTVYPLIDEDGEGGAFAEWKAGDTRIEISVDAELEAHASIAEAGITHFYIEFDDSRHLTLEAKQQLRHSLDRYSGLVRAGNPDWLTIFVG